MKIVIMALGTRGDIEPLLTIGSILKSREYDVVCGMSEQFKNLIDDCNLRFHPFSKKYLEIIESETGSNFMEQKGSFLKKFNLFLQMYRQLKPLQKELVKQQRELIKNENPDRVVYNMKCLYPVLWGMANPNKSYLVLPIPGTLHKVVSYSPVLPNSKYAYRFNKLIFYFVQNAYSKQIKGYKKEFHKDFHQLKLTKNSIKEFILDKEDALYTISPTIFKRPEFWPENAKVVGYHERIRTSNWEPDENLLHFVKKYNKILFVTFGSMMNTDPEQKTKIILEILEKHRIAAIINTASGGLVKPKSYPESVYFTDTIPYEWIFPKVYAVIHHGGSGTTHTALKYGCASMVIPHILDQHFWAYIVAKNGIGPRGIPVKKMNASKLEPLLLQLLNKNEYKLNSERIAEQMKGEGFGDKLMEVIK